MHILRLWRTWGDGFQVMGSGGQEDYPQPVKKMHKKPVKIVEVRRVIFQEDGHENAREQQKVAQRQEEVRVREDE